MNNIQSLPEDSFLKSEMVLDLVDNIKNIDLKQLINLDMIAQYAKGAINIATGVFDFFVAIVVSVYILLQRGQIINFFKKRCYLAKLRKISLSDCTYMIVLPSGVRP
jgi:predicted PurR-regulated permease PerM